ncbi:MAG: hypothetical protein WD024_08850 [Bacillota bacterium]
MPSPSKLRSSLERNGVDAAVMEQVYQGFEAIEDKSPKKAKAVFMRHAMKVLDDNLPYERRYEILDGCACCLGGSREQKVKRFLRDIADGSHTLAEKVDRLRQARPFYNSTRLNADGTITDGVYYQVDGEYHCACTMRRSMSRCLHQLRRMFHQMMRLGPFDAPPRSVKYIGEPSGGV